MGKDVTHKLHMFYGFRDNFRQNDPGDFCFWDFLSNYLPKGRKNRPKNGHLESFFALNSAISTT